MVVRVANGVGGGVGSISVGCMVGGRVVGGQRSVVGDHSWGMSDHGSGIGDRSLHGDLQFKPKPSLNVG